MIDNNAKIIKHKVGLLNLEEELNNVSKACKVMGLSRDTFYRYKSAAYGFNCMDRPEHNVYEYPFYSYISYRLLSYKRHHSFQDPGNQQDSFYIQHDHTRYLYCLRKLS